jgi:hypothetical protein
VGRERLLEVARRLRGQHFRCGLRAGGEIDEEGSPQSFIEASVIQQRLHVEEVAGMLTRQGRRKLAGVQVGEVQHLDLGESESLLDARAHPHCPHRMHGAPHDGRRLDLHTRAIAAGDEPMDSRCLRAAGLHLQPQRSRAQRLGNFLQRRGDFARVVREVADG